jgi:hypothetical protein
MWMLLPAVIALHLRRRQLGRLEGPGAAGRVVVWGIAEGLCWGLACLFKPFVVVPGLMVWLASAALLHRSSRRSWARLAVDAVGLLAGGLLTVALWQGWLIACGSWQAYWHNVAVCRGDYYSTAAPLWLRPAALLFRLPPWGAVHLVAVAVAVEALARALLRQPQTSGRARTPPGPTPLLAAMYLGWLVQSAFMAQAYDYHIAPTLLLAVTVVAGWLATTGQLVRGVWFALGVAALLGQPAIYPSRLALWERCWVEGSSPETRDRLALNTGDVFATHWRDLKEVELFLQERGVGDGELLCYDGSTHPLYLQLGVRPGTRILNPSTFIYFLSGRRDEMRAELRASSPRYVVVDTRASLFYEALELGRKPDPDVTDPAALSPELAQRFPYSEPVVFRSGRYLVHQVRQTERCQP